MRTLTSDCSDFPDPASLMLPREADLPGNQTPGFRMPKITKRIVDGLMPDQGGRDVFCWDSELRGFGIRLKPSGAGAFIIQYRNKDRRNRRMVLGKVGTLTPDEARGLAREHLASVAKGMDPSHERHQ